MGVYYPQGGATLRILFENFLGFDDPNFERAETDSRERAHEIRVQCKSIQVEINNYTEADTARVVIDYKSFPFDPRTIRALGITIHMANIKKSVQDGKQVFIEPTAPDPARGEIVRERFDRHNTIFQGFADQNNIDFDENTRDVTIEARDYTALFIDRRIINRDPKTGKVTSQPIAANKKVITLLQELINTNPSTKGKIRLDIRTETTRLNAVDPSFNIAKTVKNLRRTDSYWDVMRTIADRAAVTIYMELDRLVVTSPRNIYDDRTQTLNAEGRRLASQKVQMVYGINVKSLSFARNIGRQRNINITVYAVDPEGRANNRNLIVNIPKDLDKIKNSTQEIREFVKRFGSKEARIPILQADGTPSQMTEPAPPIPFKVPNVTSRSRLIQIGMQTYIAYNRQQLEGQLTTNDMEFATEEIPKPGQTKPPARGTTTFRSIRIGTPIEVLMDQLDLEKIKQHKNKADRVAYLKARGYPDNIASQFAQSLSDVKYLFYTEGATITLDAEQGFSMQVRFVNFIDLTNKGIGS